MKTTNTTVAFAAVSLALVAGALAGPTATWLEIVADRPNVVEFAPVQARFVRVLILACSMAQPCIDELEVYGPGSDTNLASAEGGAKASASSCLAGYPIHQIEHLNDGKYGNDHSWIAASERGDWAQIELAEATQVSRIVLSRDRAGRFGDRLPLAFEVLTSMDGEGWETAIRVSAANVVVPEEKVILPNRAVALEFEPAETRFVRIEVRQTNSAPPCIDELELFGEDGTANLALAEKGAKASASSCIEGFAIHQIPHLNDGQYGNAHSWICGEPTGWAQVELPQAAEVRRICFSRDRGGTYRDRVPTEFDIKISTDGRNWRVVKRIIALLNVPVDRPLRDETPRDWAERIAAALPPEMGSAGRELCERVVTAADVEPLLALYRLHERRVHLLRALPLEFNLQALRLAVEDLMQEYPGRFRAPEGFETSLAGYEKRLPELRQALTGGSIDELKEALSGAEEILAFARRTLLGNPLLSFGELLMLRRPLPPPGRNDTYWDWGQRYGFTVNWSCDFRPKNPPIAPWWDDALVALRMGADGSGLRTVYKPPTGHMIQQPELHWDAGRIAFAMPGPDGAFQVFEVGVDGRDLRQLTVDTAPDVDNGDPCYLPDGRIIFNSTRGFQAVPCEDGFSYVSGLCIMDADGGNTRMLTFDQESNWHPAVLNDGRVLYTRYEYANISHQFGRLLFRMNPDGTGQMALYGSNSYWPTGIFYGRPIPNRPTTIAGVVCGHHGPNKTGRLVLIDTNKGERETDGVVQAIPGRGQPVAREVVDELYAGVWPKFAHPWPLSDKYFLVAARLQPDQEEYAIYLVDVFDNITEVCRVPGVSLMEPIPLQPRPKPPVIPDRAVPGSPEATVFLSDVYRGAGLSGVPRGSVRALRVFAYNYLYRDAGQRGFGHLATVGVDGPWEPRYLLGTVPVSEDGSAYFRVPANLPVSVQPLDESGRALQAMRSWFTAMPGEAISCVGCHEQQAQTAPVTRPASIAAPASIAPWRGPPRGFDFEGEVQPVLDRFCAGCHDGSLPGLPDFSRKSEDEKGRINRKYHASTESTITTTFTPAFIALHPYVRRAHAESNYAQQAAVEFGADTSPLVQMLEKGHHGVELDTEGWDRLITWIDLSAPDHGSWKLGEWGVPSNYYERRLEMFRQFAGRTIDVEWMPIPSTEAVPFHPPPIPATPQPLPECQGWPFSPEEAQRRQQACGLPAVVPVQAGGVTLEMCLIPAGEYVMGTPIGPADEQPPCRVRIAQPFYMSRCEITNAQFAALVAPTHRSGHVSWQSIDWRGEGYSLDEPEQPAVRVSWDQAQAFCRVLGVRAGRECSLPTEAQWEWACRAGAGTALWYGGTDDDFSRVENLAGREQRGFAFDGKRKWYLRDDRFDDGAMVTARVGSYAANPWGLQDMAGNACEWTATAYRPYPYDPRDGREDPAGHAERVVRGGSWYDMPARAGSSFRWKYAPWRKVHNVGFRVVMPAEGA